MLYGQTDVKVMWIAGFLGQKKNLGYSNPQISKYVDEPPQVKIPLNLK